MANPIYTTPRTEAHLRDVLFKLQQDVTTGEGNTEVLQSILTPEAVADQALALGDVVYVASAGHIDKAQANAAGTHGAVGIVAEAIANGGTGSYQTNGVVENTGWALSAGSIYYLSPTVAGAMTATAPSTVGQYVVPLGRALSATKFQINIGPSVLL